MALEVDGFDVSRVVLVDADTGVVTELKPRSGGPLDYTPQAPWFRRPDGMVVVGCTTGVVDPHNPSPPSELVMHDPVTGEERERTLLQPEPWGFDYDPSGTHQLLVADHAIYRRSGGRVTRIPRLARVRLAVW